MGSAPVIRLSCISPILLDNRANVRVGSTAAGLLLVLGSMILERVTERKHDHVMSGAAEPLAYVTAVKPAPTR